MKDDNDTIRRIVAELDKEIATLEIVARIPGMEPEVAIAVQRLKEARFWLKDAGHGSWLDMPTTGETK